MQGNATDSGAPVFVLATRLFVHYKFKTRQVFEPAAMLIDDAYAHEVLAKVRAVGDARLRDMADQFEAARFGSVAARSPAHKAAAPKDRPMDLMLIPES